MIINQTQAKQTSAVLDKISIIENGVYQPSGGVDGFSKVVVNVPAQGESKPLLQAKYATENGVVEADEGYDGLEKVIVSVPTVEVTDPVLIELRATENGKTYLPPYGVDGFNKVVVAVQIADYVYAEGVKF